MSVSAASVLDALGDPTRRSILERLVDGPLAVGLLADQLPVSRPAVSQHLRVLKQAQLVIETAAGTRRLYRINPAGLAAVRDYLDHFWATALDSFAALAAAEAQQTTEGSPEPDATSVELESTLNPHPTDHQGASSP
ncbi:MAG: winged helix-turn-helix transcriptional regulator [Pseudonocardiales bacterium]|nr:winged helix-turn-helix transcriptional regulator [Pseudonocardiales bacterium]